MEINPCSASIWIEVEGLSYWETIHFSSMINEKTKQIVGLADRQVDTVLNLDYGPPDTRAFGGFFLLLPTIQDNTWVTGLLGFQFWNR